MDTIIPPGADIVKNDMRANIPCDERRRISQNANDGLENRNATNPVFNMLAYSFVFTLNQHMGHRLALSIARESGLLAGEKYTYNYLDLQDSPNDFLERLRSIRGKTGLAGWKIEKYDTVTGDIAVTIQPPNGCPGRSKSVQSLQCGYMEGFILGILESYTNCKYSVKAECGNCGNKGTRSPEEDLCYFRLCPKSNRKNR